MNQPNKVKAREGAFKEWKALWNRGAFMRSLFEDPENTIIQELWQKALDSVILPEGKRFEVGDDCLVYRHDKEKWVYAVIGAAENDYEMWIDPIDVRPLPQTRELTAEEGVEACVIQAMQKVQGRENKAHDTILADAWATIGRALANGKTLDQLCADYGVPMMKEI